MTREEVEVLLVEDDPSDVMLTLDALRKANLANHVRVLRDGAEALDFIFCRGEFSERGGLGPPRLILLDIKLPKVDGLEVARQLKGDPRTKTIPLIIMSGSREAKDLALGYEYGINGYVQKPMDFDQFRDTVTKLGLYWLVINQPPPPRALPGGTTTW